MNKMKKIISSIEVFFVGTISKVYAIGTDDVISLYAVDPGIRLRTGKRAIPVVLFIIGLIVILNKKITKKAKAIVVSILVILAILGVALMNYLSKIV